MRLHTSRHGSGAFTPGQLSAPGSTFDGAVAQAEEEIDTAIDFAVMAAVLPSAADIAVVADVEVVVADAAEAHAGAIAVLVAEDSAVVAIADSVAGEALGTAVRTARMSAQAVDIAALQDDAVPQSDAVLEDDAATTVDAVEAGTVWAALDVGCC